MRKEKYVRHPIASLRMFLKGAWLAYLALFTWATPRNYLLAKIVAPLSQLLFCVYLGMAATGRDSADFYLVGNALFMASMNGIYGMTMVIGLERGNGTLPYVLGSPVNRSLLLLARAFFHILDGALLVVICLTCSFLFGLNMSAANLPGLGLAILVVSLSICGAGILLGSISLVALNVTFINNTIFFLLLIFSGANIPLAQMPGWAQVISAGLPLTHGIQAARLFVSGSSSTNAWLLLGEECLIGAFYAVLGLALFRWLEFLARRRGSLEAL